VVQKVLVSLKTLALGSFQNSSKDCLGASQSTVSKCLEAFVNTLNKKALQFIYMPQTRTVIQEIKQDFYRTASFPRVLCCVDGTHISLIAPSEDEYLYVNRKKFHSINVQAIGDANLCFLDVVAKWPGSSHDSFILQASRVHDKFESAEFGEGWLLGDSGYPLKSWLMTPIDHPQSRAEVSYNRTHKKLDA